MIYQKYGVLYIIFYVLGYYISILIIITTLHHLIPVVINIMMVYFNKLNTTPPIK